MRPLAALPDTARIAIRGVFADIDDTVSTGGRVTAAAYAAMERLRQAGLLVIPVTGRPAGWCDHIARMWPVDAVVGENGALYMFPRRAIEAAQETLRQQRFRPAGCSRANRRHCGKSPARGAGMCSGIRPAVSGHRPRDRLL